MAVAAKRPVPRHVNLGGGSRDGTTVGVEDGGGANIGGGVAIGGSEMWRLRRTVFGRTSLARRFSRPVYGVGGSSAATPTGCQRYGGSSSAWVRRPSRR
jgi:hypothetical protein